MICDLNEVGVFLLGLAIDRSRVQFSTGPLSRNIAAQLSLASLRGR